MANPARPDAKPPMNAARRNSPRTTPSIARSLGRGEQHLDGDYPSMGEAAMSPAGIIFWPLSRLSAKHDFSSLPKNFSSCWLPMPRRLPPLNALKAFEAAARHESFTRAAEELCVTQGAVSHQVKALEAELGLKLFNRERQRLVITEAGRAYLVVVRDAFDRIGDGTERLLQRQNA